jgi:CDGSH-type Zn-finger protein
MEDSQSEDTARIEVAPDGPYRITGVALTDATGQNVETRPKFALCRCGDSATKPFCDGTHKRNGFSGANESDASKRALREYTSPQITVHDRRWICSHAAECLRGQPAVFRKGGRPWIVPDGGDLRTTIEVIRRCPSGALDYTLTTADLGIEPTPPVEPPCISVEKNGPYHIRGPAVLQDANGIEPPVAGRFVLCRCGQSKNKPFCDGSHVEARFQDDSTT